MIFAMLSAHGFAGKYSDSKITRTIYETPEHDYPTIILNPEFNTALRHTGIPTPLGEIELTYAKFVDPPSLVPIANRTNKAPSKPPVAQQDNSADSADNNVHHVFADVLNELGIAIETPSPSETTVEASIDSKTTVEVPIIRKSPEPHDSKSREEVNDVIRDLIQTSDPPATAESPAIAKTVPAKSAEPEIADAEPESSKEKVEPESSPEQTTEPEPAVVADTKSAEPSTPSPATPVYSPQFVARNQRIRWLKQRIEQCLAVYRQQHMNTGENGCWSTMHAILGLGQQARIQIHTRRGVTENALQWLCDNQPCARRQLFYITESGDIGVREGPGYQGHPGQFLAVAAQIQVPRSQRLLIQGQRMTIEDLIESEKRTCRLGTELTFKLIGLMHYLQSDEQWQNVNGETWDIPKLISAELSEKVNGAACGGTHRIMAVSHAALKRQFRNEPMTGQWWRAQKYMRDYQRYTLSLQNRDGSFSSEWFKKRAINDEKDRQIQTTGHILEWLVFSLESKELTDPRITNSVMFLTNLMIENRFYEWEQGPKWHAVRALDLYYRRAFGSAPPNNIPMARQMQQRNQRVGIFSRILK